MLDILGLLEIIILIIIGFTYGFEIRNDTEWGDLIILTTVRLSFLYAPFMVLMVLKIRYGVSWFFYGRSRANFLRYYYATITLAGSFMSISINVALVTFKSAESSSIMQMVTFPYCILEILLVKTHIRYMDSLQFARHSILKDRLIL